MTKPEDKIADGVRLIADGLIEIAQRQPPGARLRTPAEDHLLEGLGASPTPDVGIDRSLTTKQVSEMLGVATATLHSWRSRGEGPPSRKLIGVVTYPLTGLRKWLAEQDAAAGR